MQHWTKDGPGKSFTFCVIIIIVAGNLTSIQYHPDWWIETPKYLNSSTLGQLFTSSQTEQKNTLFWDDRGMRCTDPCPIVNCTCGSLAVTCKRKRRGDEHPFHEVYGHVDWSWFYAKWAHSILTVVWNCQYVCNSSKVQTVHLFKLLKSPQTISVISHLNWRQKALHTYAGVHNWSTD